MKCTKQILALSVIIIVTLGVSVSNVSGIENLLINGSFEDGPDPGGWLALDPGATVIVGWMVTRDQVDYVGPGSWVASDGVRSFDLNGSPGAGGIAQNFSTTPGHQYQVVFDMAGNPTDPQGVNRLRVEAAGQSSDFAFDTTGHSFADMAWLTHDWTFVAINAVTTLEIFSLDPPSLYGPALDNVIVTPEPATLTMLLIAGLALFRRRLR